MLQDIFTLCLVLESIVQSVNKIVLLCMLTPSSSFASNRVKFAIIMWIFLFVVFISQDKLWTER